MYLARLNIAPLGPVDEAVYDWRDLGPVVIQPTGLEGYLAARVSLRFTVPVGLGPGTYEVAVLDSEGHARYVPWARDADAVVVLWQGTDGWSVADVPRDRIELTEAVNLAAEPRDHVRVDLSGLSGTPVSDTVAEQFRYRGALARVLMSAGAMDRILELVVEHTTAR